MRKGIRFCLENKKFVEYVYEERRYTEMSFCSKCGTNNAEESLFCTECGAVIKDNSLGRTEPKVLPGMESKPTSKKKVAGIIACVLVWLVLVANVFGSSSSRTTPEMRAVDLGKEYLDNASFADTKYKNAHVRLNGIVARKGQYMGSNNLWVEVYRLENGEGKKVEILLDIPIQEKTKVNNLKIGDIVEVEGKCIGQVPQLDKKMISVQISTTDFSN